MGIESSEDLYDQELHSESTEFQEADISKDLDGFLQTDGMQEVLANAETNSLIDNHHATQSEDGTWVVSQDALAEEFEGEYSFQA